MEGIGGHLPCELYHGNDKDNNTDDETTVGCYTALTGVFLRLVSMVMNRKPVWRLIRRGRFYHAMHYEWNVTYRSNKLHVRKYYFTKLDVIKHNVNKRYVMKRDIWNQVVILYWIIVNMSDCVRVITGRNEVLAKVIFSQACVKNSVHRGGVCALIICALI